MRAPGHSRNPPARWRGGSAAFAQRAWTGWGGYACSSPSIARDNADTEHAAPPTRLRPSGFGGTSPLARRSFSEGGSPPLASLAGGGETQTRS
jgi:hypothetical protein